MPYRYREQPRPVIVPIAIIAFAFVVSVALFRTQVAFHKIAKNEIGITATDLIACRFLNEDAQGHATQSENSGAVARAQERVIRRTQDVINLFLKGANRPGATKAAKATTRILVAYLQSEVAAQRESRLAALRNQKITRKLALKGVSLAAELHC